MTVRRNVVVGLIALAGVVVVAGFGGDNGAHSGTTTDAAATAAQPGTPLPPKHRARLEQGRERRAAT